jgi:hypothetical protein
MFVDTNVAVLALLLKFQDMLKFLKNTAEK